MDSTLGQPQDADVANAFKAAMRRFAASVSIVTISKGDTKAGITATAVSSLSMDPPALLVCVNRSASIHNDMCLGKAFCVNILNDEHADLSGAFGGRIPADERFSIGEWHWHDEMSPYLGDAQANVFCIVDEKIDYATHTIFIGKVESVRLNGEFRPLVFGDGQYFSIGSK